MSRARPPHAPPPRWAAAAAGHLLPSETMALGDPESKGKRPPAWWLAYAAMILAAFFVWRSFSHGAKSSVIEYSALITQLEHDEVARLEIGSDAIVAQLKPDQ